MIQQKEIQLPAYGRGFHLITHIIENNLREFNKNGLLNIFIKHTSAGLTLNENADPSVRVDFETIFNKLIPENMSEYTHILEGSDDMPAHVKSSLTGVSLTIPVINGKLNIGIWQGVYLCEYRNHGGRRRLVLTMMY